MLIKSAAGTGHKFNRNGCFLHIGICLTKHLHPARDSLMNIFLSSLPFLFSPLPLNKRKGHSSSEVLKTSVLSVFLALFTCWCETHIPRKVPESENFYEILRSRTFVKFRINTGFTASCFFGTLLIVFAEIKDFYEFTRCRQHTTSTCTVSQN